MNDERLPWVQFHFKDFLSPEWKLIYKIFFHVEHFTVQRSWKKLVQSKARRRIKTGNLILAWEWKGKKLLIVYVAAHDKEINWQIILIRNVLKAICFLAKNRFRVFLTAMVLNRDWDRREEIQFKVREMTFLLLLISFLI